ncbi:MAG: methyl-accepting chemotaxis protein [Selenomonas sp.]|uniref:methyl-accepting chemotaxis protein n=1 Tax=Selenomonas sp. TaxID=2053611 RepID=UPI0025DA11E1|nr:methyl-accepting chemotaxis protein [Selenomonas sp.]MCR5757447.1 methyl-accepting chemotaxis protein [Selenomonas sp.]
MKLQTKAVLGINLFIVIACLCVGMIGYYNAMEGFCKSLQMKADSSVNLIQELMEERYPGDWHLENNLLFKGDKRIEGADAEVDALGKMVSGHVTFFKGENRVTTTVQKEGKRSVGTPASAKVQEIVLKQGQAYTGSAEVLGESYESAYRPIKDASGKVIGMVFVGLSVHQLDDIQAKFIWSMIIALFVIIALMGVATWILTGRTMAPLKLVNSAMQKIAEGDMRGQSLEVSPDEIGELAASANQMKDKLRSLLSGVEQSSSSVADSAATLTTQAEQTSVSIQQVAESAVKLAEGTHEQIITINTLQDSANNMRDKMHTLHADAEIMANVAQQSKEKAIDGRKTVGQAVEQIKNIANQVNASANVVGTLGKRSSEIGMIVETISNIAGQTNLLALNAAIEAARAGEAGRGFAVVAEEIRKLAEQSRNATQEITQLVTAIQSDTELAVQSISEGNKSVGEGAAIVSATGESFKIIEEYVGKLNDKVMESIGHIELLNNASHETANSMKGVVDSSKVSTDEAQNVSAATEEQAATMHEITDACQQLASLAKSLRDEVSKFKV